MPDIRIFWRQKSVYLQKGLQKHACFLLWRASESQLECAVEKYSSLLSHGALLNHNLLLSLLLVGICQFLYFSTVWKALWSNKQHFLRPYVLLEFSKESLYVWLFFLLCVYHRRLTLKYHTVHIDFYFWISFAIYSEQLAMCFKWLYQAPLTLRVTDPLSLWILI